MVTTAIMRLLPNIIISETDQRSVRPHFASARKGAIFEVNYLTVAEGLDYVCSLFSTFYLVDRTKPSVV